MSAWLDYTGGDGAGGLGGEDLYTGGSAVGYQSDGTYSAPNTAIMTAPVDAGGGPAGNYAPMVLDVFKFGVGVWNQNQQRQQMMDYRRWEATQFGTYMQGQPALNYMSGGQMVGGVSGIMLIGVALLAFLALGDR